MSLGEYRVGVSFNPSANKDVDTVKRDVAALIDFCQDRLRDSSNPEAKRCFAEASTLLEDAAMWAVKGITKPNA
jgi:hypothetical protein